MKRTIALISSAAILFTGCASATSESEVMESMVEQAESEINKIDFSEQTESVSNDKTDPMANVQETEELFEEKELLNRDGLLIVLKGYTEHGQFGPEMSLYIENNTDMKLSIRSTDFSINDYSFYQSYAEAVPAGKKSNSVFSINNDHLTENNIEKVEHIEFKFEVADVTDPQDGTLLFISDVISVDI